jgi:site-specific DNA recombinase
MCGLARVSTDTQRDNYSPASQVDECLKYAKSKGYSVVGDRYVDPSTGYDTIKGNGSVTAYIDDISSSETKRPALVGALGYLQQKGYDVLVVHALDRLARDPFIRQLLERDFIDNGARIEFVIGNYDESAEGEVRKDLDATFGKWENAKRVERCSRGKRYKASQNLFVGNGRIPLGYVKDKTAYAGLAVNEPQAEIVRRIFHLFTFERMSIYQVVNELNRDGARSVMGRDFCKSSVTRILRNTAYIGYVYYNKYKRLKFANKLVERDKSEWIRINITPIIDQSVFQEAQQRLDENYTMVRRHPKRFYLLTGMVVCDDCQRPFITQAALAGRNRRVVDAQSYRHRIRSGHCSNHTISARILDELVWNKVAELLNDPVSLFKGYEASLERQREAQARQRAHLEILCGEVVKLEQKGKNLTSAYIDPDIPLTREEYIEQKTVIEDKLKGLKQEIEGLEQALGELPAPVDPVTLQEFTSKVKKGLELNPPKETKRKILELLHVKAVISPVGQIRLDGWFDPSQQGLLNITSACCAHRLLPLQRHVLRAPAL